VTKSNQGPGGMRAGCGRPHPATASRAKASCADMLNTKFNSDGASPSAAMNVAVCKSERSRPSWRDERETDCTASVPFRTRLPRSHHIWGPVLCRTYIPGHLIIFKLCYRPVHHIQLQSTPSIGDTHPAAPLGPTSGVAASPIILLQRLPPKYLSDPQAVKY
jgi:hypothetical protein